MWANTSGPSALVSAAAPAFGLAWAAATTSAFFGSDSGRSQLALAVAKATSCGCSTWNCWTLNGAFPLGAVCAYCRLSTTGFTELTTSGRKMNDRPTVRRRIQPQSASPVPTSAGFRASTISV